jgi:hypothetical protein
MNNIFQKLVEILDSRTHSKSFDTLAEIFIGENLYDQQVTLIIHLILNGFGFHFKHLLIQDPNFFQYIKALDHLRLNFYLTQVVQILG